MIGQQFARLTVIASAPKGADGRDRWCVRCDCGGEKTVIGKNLRRGMTSSCGCLQKERVSQANGTHRMAGTTEHGIWAHIKRRCLNPDDPAYQDYGKRGITVHPAWIDDFGAFVEHVGMRPSSRHSIDRIDNERGYEPGNVRWATRTEQARNRRSNKMVEYGGQSMPVAEAIEVSGTKTPWPTIYHRLQRGWPIERAL